MAVAYVSDETKIESNARSGTERQFMSTVTVYTKPACVQCAATLRALTKAGVAHTVIDITEDSAARDYVMSLGYLQAPVVVTADSHWSGYRPDRLDALTAA